MRKYIERRRVGRGFEYYDDKGQITGQAKLAYLKSLAVPPAWRDVKISTAKRTNILATGVDKAGRLQYIYSPKFRQHQENKKFEKILRFARALPKMRRITDEHLAQGGLEKEKVLACIVRLMDEAYFRVGNEEYSKANQSYGVSTLRSKHIHVSGDTVTFDFMGKSGQHQHKRVTDRAVARIIKRLDELPGYEIFKYYDAEGNLTRVNSKDVNQYIKNVMGEEFSAKDFRTWGGTLLASVELAAVTRANSERERKRTVNVCIRKVARKLGNTPAIARGSYIDPRIISSFLAGDDLKTIRDAVANVGEKGYLSNDEQCVLRLLQKTA